MLQRQTSHHNQLTSLCWLGKHRLESSQVFKTWWYAILSLSNGDNPWCQISCTIKLNFIYSILSVLTPCNKISSVCVNSTLLHPFFNRDPSNRLEFDFMREEHDIILAEEYDLTHPAVMLGHEDSDIPEHTYSLRVSYCHLQCILHGPLSAGVLWVLKIK